MRFSDFRCWGHSGHDFVPWGGIVPLARWKRYHLCLSISFNHSRNSGSFCSHLRVLRNFQGVLYCRISGSSSSAIFTFCYFTKYSIISEETWIVNLGKPWQFAIQSISYWWNFFESFPWPRETKSAYHVNEPMTDCSIEPRLSYFKKEYLFNILSIACFVR